MDLKSSLPIALMSKLAGRRVGSFDLVRVLGTGATGVVYLASDVVLRRNVALKIIARSEDATDALLHEVFMREARAAARLVHPHVVQIYQIGESQEFRYIAMEYVPGMTALKKAKQSGDRLPQDMCMKMMREAADAFVLADSMGICHRDIKPSNLLLTPSLSLKIADFGLAAQSTGSESIGGANASQIQGTAYYMSPEQWQGGEITIASDVYSLGCTIYRLMSGTPPYGKLDFFACLQAHCHSPVPDPGLVVPSMDPLLANLLKRCMAKSAGARPAPSEIIEVMDHMLLHRRHGLALPAPEVTPPPELAEGTMNVQPSSMRSRLQMSNLQYQKESDIETDVKPPSVQLLRESVEAAIRDPGSRTYQSFFSLRGYPFSDIRQPGQFWQGGPYGWALRTLAMQITTGSRSSMLLGPSGSGRTFLCDMLQHSHPDITTFRIEPQLLFGERILVALCRQQSLDPNPGASLRFLTQVLLSHSLPLDRPSSIAIIVVDVLDASDTDVVSDLHDILYMSGNSQLALLLVGTEDMREQLAARGAPQALYNAAPPVALRPMTQDEMVEYIHFRMSAIGGSTRALTLDRPMRQLLHIRTGGSPKLVNVYCHNTLTIAALRGERAASFESLRLGMKRNSYLTPDAAGELILQPTR